MQLEKLLPSGAPAWSTTLGTVPRGELTYPEVLDVGPAGHIVVARVHWTGDRYRSVVYGVTP